MSYSLIQQCSQCKKQPQCMDGTIIQAAVSIIHSLGVFKGHLGSGTITHECAYCAPKQEEQREVGANGGSL